MDFSSCRSTTRRRSGRAIPRGFDIQEVVVLYEIEGDANAVGGDMEANIVAKVDRQPDWKRIGFVVMATYLCLVVPGAAAVLGLIGGLSIQTMKINEVGDTLAGVFAPVALLWLFVATMVQSQELELQRKELKLQRKEFELTRLEMVENRKVAQDQAEQARSQAKFIETQTEMMVRSETDRHLGSLVQSLIDFASTYLRGPVQFAPFSETVVFSTKPPFSGNPQQLAGLVRSVHECVTEVRAIVVGRATDNPVHLIYSSEELRAFIDILDEIRALHPGASAAQKAVLQAAHFDTLVEDIAYLYGTLMTP